jgi:hypothetical protein
MLILLLRTCDTAVANVTSIHFGYIGIKAVVSKVNDNNAAKSKMRYL